MTELKNIIKPHFKKIGFNIKSYFIEKSKFKYSVVKNLFYTDEGINIVLGEKGGNGFDALSSDYATIITGDQYIDCLAKYIRKKCEMRENNSGNKIYNYKKYSFFNELDVLETVIEEISKGLYGKHVGNFISYIANDE